MWLKTVYCERRTVKTAEVAKSYRMGNFLFVKCIVCQRAIAPSSMLACYSVGVRIVQMLCYTKYTTNWLASRNLMLTRYYKKRLSSTHQLTATCHRLLVSQRF